MNLEWMQEIAVCRINTGKANAMGAAFFDALNRTLDQLEAESPRALVLTGYDRFFSAGLALPELATYDRPQLKRFLVRFGRSLRRLFGLPFPVIAAINGHAIAGGCVLAMQADRRICADIDIKIGVNEVQLGLALPPAALEPIKLQLSPSSWYPVFLEGKLYAPSQAAELGLVDRIVEADKLLDVAIHEAQQYAAMPPEGIQQVKLALRQPTLELLEQFGDEHVEGWLDSWFSPRTQTTLDTVIQRLS